MKKLEFFTESNSITYEITPTGKFWIEFEGNRRGNALRFDSEDLPSLILFLEKLIEDLKKEK